MANWPANAGAHSARPQRGPAGAPLPVHQQAAPPPVHHQGFPRSRTAPASRETAPVGRETAPASRRPAPASRGPARRRIASASRRAAPARPAVQVLAWLPYLIVLAGVGLGLFVAGHGSQNAGPGAAVVGATLLGAALARLLLPPRYAGLLVSRGRALDVAVLTALGAAVLGVALSLP